MADTGVGVENIREDAARLLAYVGVSRIIVVDDEYAVTLEELLGICSELLENSDQLTHLGDVDFGSADEVWKGSVRNVWESLDDTEREGLVFEARAAQLTVGDTSDGESVNLGEGEDFMAAERLDDVLGKLADCEFLKLSLAKWRERSEELLSDTQATSTLLLFDRNFSREEQGMEEEGFRLMQSVQAREIGYCGLISHTVQVGGEYEAWDTHAEEYSLSRDRFVVIAKERLTKEQPDYYGFLGMLRLAALSSRYAKVKSIAWTVFINCMNKVRTQVDHLSVLDFDRIVFESSLRDGVWEPDTLFRVFGILMRREARTRLHEDVDFLDAVDAARRVSNVPSIARALGGENVSREAVRIQRFEMYDTGEELNGIHAPLELGDVFESVSNRKKYILFVQPCDLMVRSDGTRSRDEKLGRMGTMVELVQGEAKKHDWWGELQFYEESTGKRAFANFASAHQVSLAVLDLCVVRTDGAVQIKINGSCPGLLIEPWKKRYPRLQKFFRSALRRYKELEKKQVVGELRALALPKLSTTMSVPPAVNGDTVTYGFRRILRLRQPWSAALYTEFAQYLARTAFEPPFEYRIAAQADEDP